MADITRLFRLHDRLATQLSIPIWGVACIRRIDFKNNATAEQRQQAQLIADNWEVLTPSATKTTIIGNGVDSTIITLSGVTTFQYKVYNEDELIAINSGTINDGILELTSVVVGQLVVELVTGNSSAFIEIEVTDG